MDPGCESGGKTAYTATIAEDRSPDGAKHEESKDAKITEALGHDYQAVAGSGKVATCTEPGKEADQKCSRCDAVIDGAAIPALGHDWGEWAQTKAPTCTGNGEEQRVCRNDETHKEAWEVAALGHKWDAGKVTKEATAAAEGVRTFTCTVCGETKTEPIPRTDAFTVTFVDG